MTRRSNLATSEGNSYDCLAEEIMPVPTRKDRGTKPKEKLPPEPVEDTPKIDWEKLDAVDVPQTAIDQWHAAASDAARNENLDAFQAVLKSITPVSGLVHLFQHHHNDFADCDLIKIAVIRGCKSIVDCMIVVLGETKFYEFARWGHYLAIHIASIWGHVELVELFHDYHVKTGQPTACSNGETVTGIAQRYRQSEVSDYYAWCDLREKYVRVLASLIRQLDRAAPQHDRAVPQHEPVVYTAEDLDRYRAGCQEKLQQMKAVKFHAMPTAVLLHAIAEACEFRFKVKTFLPRPEDQAKEKGKRGGAKGGAKGKKK
ncbi:hypothetical protein BV898_09132 [Hypsibius exemplaris]|uniref:Uncharacterized protein n=1 Tax=Hypsibius exemplaris TaxID=2072580 RepID=A0A1W0WNI2_HYPEX|nr:hypothetical protein BV898_09132 [Hypsibius exemplaris]